MFSREIFASRLTNLCKEAGITNAAFADSCGITPGALSMLQKANRSPSVELLCKMADLLGVTVDYLSGSDDAPVSQKNGHALLGDFRACSVRPGRSHAVRSLCPG